MHEALVGPGGEGVRAVGRDRGFGRHPGVSDPVGAGHGVEAEPLRDLVRPADFLENLHAPAAAYDGQLRHSGDLRARGGFPCLRYREDEMGVAHNMRQSRTVGLEAADDGVVVAAARSTDRQLDRARRRGAVDGETGGIRSAIAQRAQHARKQWAELRFERVVLQKQPDDAAHCQMLQDQ